MHRRGRCCIARHVGRGVKGCAEGTYLKLLSLLMPQGKRNLITLATYYKFTICLHEQLLRGKMGWQITEKITDTLHNRLSHALPDFFFPLREREKKERGGDIDEKGEEELLIYLASEY